MTKRSCVLLYIILYRNDVITKLEGIRNKSLVNFIPGTGK